MEQALRLKRGTMLAHYRILRHLGTGGMGTVYEAEDLERGRRVALKTLRKVKASRLLLFKREFRTVAKLSHRNWIRVHELMCVDGTWLFTMELIDGVPFDRWCGDRSGHDAAAEAPTMMHGSGGAPDSGSSPKGAGGVATTTGRSGVRPAPCPSDRITEALAQLAGGVHALHAAGVLHLDLKPANVLVTPEGRVVILDFGLATLTAGPRGKTSKRLLVGTPEYMSPEQARGDVPSEASDWYSVGVMLFEVLVGRLPFSGERKKAMMQRCWGDAPGVASSLPSVEPVLAALGDALLARRVEERISGDRLLDRLGVESRPSLSAASSGVHRIATPAIVGRTDELARVGALLGRTSVDVGTLCLILGESGIGKTALLDALQDEAEGAGFRVLRGRCHERETVPFNAFDGIVDDLFGRLADLTFDRLDRVLCSEFRDLARLFPILGEFPVLDDGSPADPSPAAARARAFQILREVLRIVAERRRIVLMIDDLHWIDDDSLSMLRALLSPLPPGVAIVATLRPDEGERRAGLLPLFDAMAPVSTDLVLRLSLGPLDEESAVEFARALLPASRRGAAEGVAREAGGSPFLLEELAHDVEAQRALVAREGAPTLPELLARRLDGLSEDARTLLEVISVAGHPIQQDTAQLAAGLAPGDADAIEQLRAASLVLLPGARLADLVEPSHDRLRNAVMARLDETRTAALHLRLADLLEEGKSNDSMQVVVHLLAGGAEERATELALAAGREAFDALAFGRAAELFRTARTVGVGEGGSELLLLEARCRANDGQGPQAAGLYEEAAALLEGGGRLDVMRLAAEQWLVSGHLPEGLSALLPVLKARGLSWPKTPARAMAVLIGRILLLRIFGGREPSPVPLSPEQAAKIELAFSAWRGFASLEPIRSTYFALEAIGPALRTADPARRAVALAVWGLIESYDGNEAADERASILFDRADGEVAATQEPYPDAFACSCRGVAAFICGRWVDAVPLLKTAETKFEEGCVGVRWELVTLRTTMLNCLWWGGDLGRIRTEVGPWLREALAMGDRFAVLELRIFGALPLIDAGRIDEARSELTLAVGDWTGDEFFFQHWTAAKFLAFCDLLQDRPIEATATRVETAFRDADKAGLLSMRLMRVDAWTLRGRLQAAQARRAHREGGPVPIRPLRRTAARLRRERHPFALGSAHALDAAAAELEGDLGAANEALDAAALCFEEASAGLYSAAITARRASLARGGDSEPASGGREPGDWTRALLP
jgi:serine/threonine protein kinase